MVKGKQSCRRPLAGHARHNSPHYSLKQFLHQRKGINKVKRDALDWLWLTGSRQTSGQQHPQEQLIYNLNMKPRQLFKRAIALPQDHGSWVFLFSPLLIGLFAGQNFSAGTMALTIAAITAFLMRQPITIATKAFSGRRPRSDLPAAFFWVIFYGVILTISLAVLLAYKYLFILYLAIPGIAVFAWHLVLVSNRRERGQAGVEILATGVLALSAPAAYWVSLGYYAPDGWWLWILTWLQSAASIVYAYLRLEQRTLQEMPSTTEKLNRGKRALLYTSFNLCFTAILSILNILPSFIFLPYLLQWLETLWGIMKPAVGQKPTRIGIRQLIVSSLFTLLFIFTWR